MLRSRFVRGSFPAVVVLLASSWSGVLHGQRAAESTPDAAPFAVLLQAPSGTWAIADGKRTPVEKDAASLFAQADAYGRTDNGVLVSVAIGASVVEPWSIQVRIAHAGEVGAESVRRAASELTLTGGPSQVRETREITLQPGSYEMVAVLVRRGTGRASVGTVVRRPLVVPSLTATVFEASPVVIGESVASERTAEGPRPFVFGKTRMKPAGTNRFHHVDRLHLALRIHGWKGDLDERPDLTVEYVFQQIFKGGPRFFNKIKPQELNARTLGKSFDGQASTVAAGISVPLGAFPPGEFQVVVRVRDKRSQLMTVQSAGFVVTSDGAI